MDYQTTLNKTKKLWSSYRECIFEHGPNDYRSMDLGEHVLHSILDFVPLHVENSLNENKPFIMEKMAMEISDTEKEAIKNFIVHKFNSVLRKRGEPHDAGSNYELLLESGTWSQFKGEPLERAKIRGADVMRSRRYKNVLFSYGKNVGDISYIPRLAEPNEKTSEASGVVLVSGFGCICNESSRNLGIVDSIRITKRPYEKFYIEKHLIPLFAGIFNVPTSFLVHKETKRETSYAKQNHLELNIYSRMAGSYFQNVLNVFDIVDNVPVKRKPTIRTKSDVNSLVRAFIDCNGYITRRQVKFLMDDKSILNIVKECIGELGFETSEITPLFQKYKLEFEEKEGNEASYKVKDRQIPIGNVYKRLGRARYEKIGRVVRHIKKGKKWKKERRPSKIVIEVSKNFEPIEELYQEKAYSIVTEGGEEKAERIVGDTLPKNPNKLLRLLNKEIIIPDIYNSELQEFVYNEWYGDLNVLKERVKTFTR